MVLTIVRKFPHMPNPSLELVKNCLRIKTTGETHYIKKECVLGYKETGDNLDWSLTIYTNIPGADICINFRIEILRKSDIYPYTQSYGPDESAREEYRKCRKLLVSILSPEVEQPTVQTTADNVLKN